MCESKRLASASSAPNIEANTVAAPKSNPPPDILIIGYGNPGRQDDGLGPVSCVHLREPEGMTVSIRTAYQLNVEDALDVAQSDYVVFIDASINATAPFSFDRITPKHNAAFGSHSLNPEGVLELCDALYQKQPEAYVLAIRGYDFDGFKEQLSDRAKHNMLDATQFLNHWLFDKAEVHARKPCDA